MNEIWKVIEDYEDYEVSNLGRIKKGDIKVTTKTSSYIRPNLISIKKDRYGYECVKLRKNKKAYYRFVHRLVAQAFIPNPNNYPQINHINEIKHDNNVDNLEWCTGEYNNAYGTRVERMVETRNKSGNYHIGVIQYNLYNEVIREWDSINEAARDYSDEGRGNVNSIKTAIIQCCRGRQKTCLGYKWEYKKR